MQQVVTAPHGGPQVGTGAGLEDRLWSLLQRTAAEVAVASGHAERRSVRHRFVQLYRRRRLRYRLGSSTLAAGVLAGGGLQLRGAHVGAGGGSTAAGDEAPATGRPVSGTRPTTTTDSAESETSSWTWNPQAGMDREAADPGALFAGDRFHVYTTSATHCTAGQAGQPDECPMYWVPRFTSPDLSQPGQLQGDAMPSRPDWVAHDDRIIWAPSVAQIGGDGNRYVLYFAATSGRAGDDRMKCLGAAVGPRPEGPFRPLAEPLRCVPGYWTIDPYPVLDGGRWYLLWREDDAHHTTGKIVAAPLTDDGLAIATGRPTTLMVGRSGWEDGYPNGAGEPGDEHGHDDGIGPIENPAMARHPATGDLLLTWSANRWEKQSYATGLARCLGPLGPCQRLSDQEPWLSTSADASVTTDATFGGTGGLSFVVGPDGQLYALLHAYAGSGQAPDARRVGWAFRVDADPASATATAAGTAAAGGPGYRLTDVVGNQSAGPAVNRP